MGGSGPPHGRFTGQLDIQIRSPGRHHDRQGRPVYFSSLEGTVLCQRLGSQHTFTTAYHPQANGMIERFYRQLKDAMRPGWPLELALSPALGPSGP